MIRCAPIVLLTALVASTASTATARALEYPPAADLVDAACGERPHMNLGVADRLPPGVPPTARALFDDPARLPCWGYLAMGVALKGDLAYLPRLLLLLGEPHLPAAARDPARRDAAYLAYRDIRRALGVFVGRYGPAAGAAMGPLLECSAHALRAPDDVGGPEGHLGWGCLDALILTRDPRAEDLLYRAATAPGSRYADFARQQLARRHLTHFRQLAAAPSLMAHLRGPGTITRRVRDEAPPSSP